MKPFVAPRMAAALTKQASKEVSAPMPSGGQQPLHVRQNANGASQVAAKSVTTKVTDAIASQNAMPAECAQDGAEYMSVLFIKSDVFLKKMVKKPYTDGILTLSADGSSMLHNLDNGKVVTTGKAKLATAKDLKPKFQAMPKKGKEEPEEDEEDGTVRYLMGSYVCEVQGDISAESFRSGACFAKTPATYGVMVQKNARPAGVPAFRQVIKSSAAVIPKGMHDPHALNAIVLNRDEWEAGVKQLGPPVAPVVVDPYVGHHLRPHQVEGVQFLYDCVMGRRQDAPGVTGCVLADEMGLGKTLQVLTLAWTLLRQGPAGKPIARKVLVVTPATLCGNWEKEVKRWLGNERLQTFMLIQTPDIAERVQQFKHGTVVKLCITSYETLRKHSAVLEGAFDLIVCDEGHRLKAVGGTKTTDALVQLGCNRRVLITGTPVQNNLQELYALISFVAPDMLGEPTQFQRVFSGPVAKAQERDADQETKDLGASRASELKRKTDAIMLRRTQAILAKHLPPLTNYVLFCKPSTVQVQHYQFILKKVQAALATSNGGELSLSALSALGKVCNHPGLLASQDSDEGQARKKQKGHDGQSILESTSPWTPPNPCKGTDDCEASGKLLTLRLLMDRVTAGGERMVVVSTSTAALDMVQKLAGASLGLSTVRIDGSTSVDDRQNIVDNFNSRGMGQIFLLSTRAGGAGLNLIGASHLVLFSSDWNPAADQQAMARIWRDGQQRHCHVWRLLTTGTFEEKIYQRQIMKGNLALATLVEGGGGGGSKQGFTRDELRTLFTLAANTSCETYDLLLENNQVDANNCWWMHPEDCEELMPHNLVLQAALKCGGLSAACVTLQSEVLAS